MVLRGSPEAGGITIDTATEPEENPIIDEWATSDVSFFLYILYWSCSPDPILRKRKFHFTNFLTHQKQSCFSSK